MGRYDAAGNGVIRSRVWKEDMNSRIAGEARRRESATDRKAVLRDPQGRRLDYLRLAVTDRCNLRCCYCMPEDGIRQVSHDDVLCYEEMLRLAALFCRLGATRIRITGGEPLVRKGLIPFLSRLGELPSRPEILLTTNGVLLGDRLDEVKRAGVRRVNLSLDSLDRETYRKISRRDRLASVLPLIDGIPAAGLGLKINMVVLPGINDHEIPAFAELARDRDLCVRFIEPMPFDGDGGRESTPFSGDRIVERLALAGPFEPAAGDRDGVAELYACAGWAGRVGVIRGHTRAFCGACSRLRLDARGRLLTCLYGSPAADLRSMILSGASDAALEDAVRRAVSRRHADGFAAERARSGRLCDSMSRIGG